jgi:hypothetical protein
MVLALIEFWQGFASSAAPDNSSNKTSRIFACDLQVQRWGTTLAKSK